jgi:hyperosmotically inducible protein
MEQRKVRYRAVGVTAATLLIGGLLATTAWAAQPSDAWITTKVKLALFTTSGVSSSDVNVDSIDGHVTLHGTVASAEEKAKAEQAARGVSGVREVRDMLAVVAPAKQKAVATKDEQIQREVEQRLRADESLAGSSISVASVNAGTVVLSGSANTLSDHLQAVNDAWQVAGVRRVASEIKSPDTLSDREIWRESGRAADAPKSTTTGTMSDMWITSAAKMRLLADSETPATSINVDTDRGVVTLFGTVPTTAAKQAAETDVAKVSGVKQVRNELQVVPESAEKRVAASDNEVQDRIEERLKNAMTDADVGVEVKNGTARLTGTVPDHGERLRALTIARSTDGVRSVIDDLQVKTK